MFPVMNNRYTTTNENIDDNMYIDRGCQSKSK